MRFSAPTVLLCAVLAAVWAQAGFPPSAQDRAGVHEAGAAARAGLAARLAAQGTPPLGPVSVQAGRDGLWRLRGRAAAREGRAAGWPVPLYAEAEARCDAGLERPGCWRLRRVELDGALRRGTLGAEAAVAAAASGPVARAP